MEKSLKKEAIIIACLFLLALGLRLIYLGGLRQIPFFDAPIVDAEYHDKWAMAIRAGETFHQGPYFRAPLYPYFLAFIYAIFGHSYLAVRLIQFAMGAGSAVLIYLVGRRVFGNAAGAIAGVLAAVYGTLIYFEGELLIPVLFLFLNLLLMLAVLSADEKDGFLRWLLCGLLLGLAAIARPNVLVFGAALLLWMAVRFHHRGWGLRKSFSPLAAYLLGALLLIAPVAVRNYTVGDDFVLIASQGGMNFYLGNNSRSDGVTAILPGAREDFWGGYQESIERAEAAAGRTLKASQVSRYWFRRGLGFWTQDPAGALRLTLKKIALFWGGAEIANNKDIYFVGRRIPLLGALVRPGPLYLPFGIAVPLALAGMVLAWRRRESSKAGLLALFIFCYMASIVPFFVTARFRLPIVPMLLPFAAYCLISPFRRKSAAGTILTVGLVVVFGLLVNLNLASYPLPPPATSHVSLGHRYLEKGQLEQAAEEFQQALDIEQGQARLTASRQHAITGLAKVRAEQGQLVQAVGMLEEAVSRWPHAAGLHFQLGHLHFAAKRLDEAIARWQEAVRLDSTLHRGYLQLAIAYEDKEMFAEAVRSYQRAIHIDPGYVFARYNLGLLYVRLGMIPQAVSQYQEVIAIDPAFTDAHAGLAWIFAKQGVRQEEGLQLMSQAIARKPENRWYQDVLAELYISTGQPQRAAAIFREMIRQEPGNRYWRERLQGVGL
jgi:tetratricopeptide (TPR) repeat protein